MWTWCDYLLMRGHCLGLGLVTFGLGLGLALFGLGLDLCIVLLTSLL